MTKARQPRAYTSHDGGPFSPVDVRVVATWPVGSFAENLAVHPDGSVFVRLHTPQRIDRYDPISGRTTSFADLLAPGMGLAFDGEGTLWATGGAFPQGPGYVWRVAQDGPFDFGPTCRTHPSSMDAPFTQTGNAARLRKHDGPDPCDRYARTPALEHMAHPMLGAKPPRHVPAGPGRLAAGEHLVVMMTQVRAGSNAKAKRELGWHPAHPSWRQGFAEIVRQHRATAR